MKKLLPLLLLLSPTSSWAERKFDIEIVVFKRNIAEEKTNESWPLVQPPISMKSVGEFHDKEYIIDKGVNFFPEEEFALTPEVDKLKKHANYEVLLHTAWRQGDYGRREAPIFHLIAGDDFSDQFRADGYQIKDKLAIEVSESGHLVFTKEDEKAITEKRQLVLLENPDDDITPENESEYVEPEIVENVSEDTLTEEQIADTDAIESDEAPLLVPDAIINDLPELDGRIQIYVDRYLYANVTLDLKSPITREIELSEEELDALALDSNTLSDTESDIASENSTSTDNVEGEIQNLEEPTTLTGNLEVIESEEAAQTETLLKSYRLSQKRRMRSSETHLLDHPLMGVIIQVRRIDIEDEEPEEEPAS
ncbi:peptidoglycan binding protein CsiV [Vibrio sp.]|nr:peptidoglycan binding protein CsiV [Vibrio sp.]